MTDQTPAGEQHPFAPMLQAMGEAARTLSADVLRDIAQFGETMHGINVQERLASLPDTTVTFEGTFDDNDNDNGALGRQLGDAPQRRDVSVQPAPHDPHPCPACGILANQIDYEDAHIADATSRVDDGMTQVSIRVDQVASARFLPCGHRFDGTTGALIEGDDG